MSSLIIPNRFQATPLDFAQGVVIETHLRVLNADAMDLLNSAFLPLESKALLESVLGQTSHWLTWVATHRPRGAPELVVSDPNVIDRFDLLIFADYPDLNARVATVRAQVRKRKMLLVGLPLAGLAGLYLLHKGIK